MQNSPQLKNILIVEDDHDIRESVAELLTMEGYPVIEARDGLEGLDRLRQMELPCIILLDMMMPVMDGPEFLTRVLADPVLCGCTVLVLTASHMQPPPGAAGILRKPFDFQALLEFVSRHCA